MEQHLQDLKCGGRPMNKNELRIKELEKENQQLKEKLQQKEDNINKAQEEFISEFYSCDNEEEALKRLYSKLCCLKEENQQLKEQLEASEKVRKEAIKYINVTEYSDIVGLNKNGIKEFWFVKDILKILDIDKGE